MGRENCSRLLNWPFASRRWINMEGLVIMKGTKKKKKKDMIEGKLKPED